MKRPTSWLARAARVGAASVACMAYGCAAQQGEEIASGSHGVTPGGDAWGCYDPEPGHPTAREVQSFLEAAGDAAQGAEARLGVPAAALTAMAAVESGFGFTRTAIDAQNYFGFKMPSSGAQGRGAYTLACQPADDPGNVYIVFASLDDSIGYVANGLATFARYAPVTQRYQADRAAGVDVVAAVDRWVQGITLAGYNPNHEAYIGKITRALVGYQLYSLSAGAGDRAAPANGDPPAGGAEPPPAAAAWLSIDEPLEGAVVSGTVPIAVTTGGGPTVTKVLFYSIDAGGNPYLITTDAAAPFGIGWATEGWVPNGSYTLRVEAYSGETKVATGLRRVDVLN